MGPVNPSLRRKKTTMEEALWKAYDAADAELLALERQVEALRKKKSDAVKEISKTLGAGPHQYNGSAYYIVRRETTYFLKAHTPRGKATKATKGDAQ